MRIDMFFVDMQKKKIGRKIRARRKYMGMSQGLLANKLNTQQGVISRIEHGEIGTINFLADICKVLDMELTIEINNKS